MSRDVLIEEIVLDAPRGPFSVLRSGDPQGPKLLCLHGWLDNAASFLPLLPHLQHCDVLALDLAGHGGSAHRHPAYDYAFVDWLHDVLDALDALGWEHAQILGHSMGGAIAAVLAAAVPQRVTRLGLIEALGPVSGSAAEASTRLRQAVAAKRAARGAKPLRPIADIELAVDARLQASAMSREAARLIVQRNLQAVEGGWAWRSDARLRLPTHLRNTEDTVRDWLAHIECPVLCIAAEDAPPYFPREQQDARFALLRDARQIRIAGSHHLHMESADIVGPMLAEFFADRARA